MQSADIFSLRFPDHAFSQSIYNIVTLIEAI
jgi:hypothetical protein